MARRGRVQPWLRWLSLKWVVRERLDEYDWSRSDDRCAGEERAPRLPHVALRRGIGGRSDEDAADVSIVAEFVRRAELIEA